ncbi:hypothetical protein ACFQ2B_00855 [Streptomyces stramineus]
MDNSRGALTALHLFLVWVTMAAVMPTLGFGLVVTAWGGGAGATVPVFVLGVPLLVGLLVMAGIPARTVVPLCGSLSRRLGWAVLVLLLGTLGVLAGLAAYGSDVDLGSAGVRIALTGAPYAVAAALFVPDRRVRLGALAVLAAGVAYGGFVSPAQAQQRRHEAEVARYREHPELLYLGAAPAGMEVSRAVAAPPPSASTTTPSGRGTSPATWGSRCARRSRRHLGAPSRGQGRGLRGRRARRDAHGPRLPRRWTRRHPHPPPRER